MTKHNLIYSANRGNSHVISAITYFEMRQGAANKKASPYLAEEIERFCARLHAVWPFDREAAGQAAAVYAALAQRGRAIGTNDLLIAGHALATGCVLVTNNTREFQRVPALKVEDWT